MTNNTILSFVDETMLFLCWESSQMRNIQGESFHRKNSYGHWLELIGAMQA